MPAPPTTGLAGIHTCPCRSINPWTGLRDGPPYGAPLHPSGIHLFQFKSWGNHHHKVLRDTLIASAKGGFPNVTKESSDLLEDTVDFRGNTVRHPKPGNPAKICVA